MAMRHGAAVNQDHKRSRPSGLGRGGDSSEPEIAASVYGISVPEVLYEAIEDERENLSKAESLLVCLVAAMNAEDGVATASCFPDVAEMARELVKRSVNRLDALVLRQVLARNKVEEVLAGALKEDYSVTGVQGARAGMRAEFLLH